MAEDQKLKPNPDGLDFDDAVGNTGHSNTHITYQQNNCLFFFLMQCAISNTYLLR